MQIFLLQFCKFSAILCFNLCKILDFDRNELYTHFCFSEVLILREKRLTDFFWAIGVPKKIYKFSKNIEKNTIQESCTKKYNLAPGAANHTFF